MTNDWTKGPPDPANTLLEYGDFECPFCGQAHGELKRLEQAIGDQLLFVFRHFPLTQMHPHAQLAAEAAEAAGMQGHFWEMHDKLFENQDRLDADDLLTYAGELKLDLPRFVQDLETHRHASKVRRDFLQGVRSGVNGTPTFFINGQRYNGPHTYEALLATLQGKATPEIEAISRLPRAGL